MPAWLQELLPILALLALIAIVVTRLPKVDLGHAPAFRRRRFMNWFPVGLTYAFLYMGRYNLNVYASAFKLKEQFATIFTVGTVVYGFSFVLNGPLTDKLGGRKTIMISALGTAVANIAMGAMLMAGRAKEELLVPFTVLYGVNMYFQSFGAVSIVKVNSAWFHLRERGTFGGVFGIMISLGLYFAYDWSRFIVDVAKKASPSAPPVHWVFYVPAIILGVFTVINFFAVRDTPGEAGQADFDTADASSGDDGPRKGVVEVAKLMLGNPVVMTIAAVEFCSGYLRNGIMQTYRFFAEGTGQAKGFVNVHWGMLLCVAGILGGMFAGVISDRVFGSRRGPVSAVLYGMFLLGTLAMFPTLANAGLGWVAIFLSLSIIGVHGMLSGTASMDFGGKKNVGVAVGIIDGFVYLGTAAGTYALGWSLPKKEAAHVAANWWTWPATLAPLALLGLVLATRLWNARPQRKAAAAH
jgi:OPA family glycerol-3-phosphate transporter-like MFS transporter